MRRRRCISLVCGLVLTAGCICGAVQWLRSQPPLPFMAGRPWHLTRQDEIQLQPGETGYVVDGPWPDIIHQAEADLLAAGYQRPALVLLDSYSDDYFKEGRKVSLRWGLAAPMNGWREGKYPLLVVIDDGPNNSLWGRCLRALFGALAWVQ